LQGRGGSSPHTRSGTALRNGKVPNFQLTPQLLSSPTWAESDRKGFQGTSSRRYGPQTLAQHCGEGIADSRERNCSLQTKSRPHLGCHPRPPSLSRTTNHPPAMSGLCPRVCRRFDSCIPMVAGLIELTVYW